MSDAKNKAREAWDKTAGSAKQAAGDATDDERLESEGAAQKSKGNAEGAWNKTKDALDDAGDALKGKD
ncbi:MAG: CsbD family protein [Anaerolineae bacterium]